ncbi:hypothetical protein G4G28_11385 [Massilia sp. Dwa41.01b]|uniref:hypothetical protein n=1 Tax=Massilia sp. Dwa41.01b TaxID=2709302 RepID=UPI0016004E85|nr:hypothetical protein [Massilia sp. Dwa41.01b]QNA87221.1 hypothetical protein G4G28_11385 [Massilia sp. Dwa41.01b]
MRQGVGGEFGQGLAVPEHERHAAQASLHQGCQDGCEQPGFKHLHLRDPAAPVGGAGIGRHAAAHKHGVGCEAGRQRGDERGGIVDADVAECGQPWRRVERCQAQARCALARGLGAAPEPEAVHGRQPARFAGSVDRVRMPFDLHLVLQAPEGGSLGAYRHPVGQVHARGRVDGRRVEFAPAVGTHEPGGRVAIHQRMAALLEQGACGVEQGAALRLGQAKGAGVAHHQVGAGNLDVHRLHDEPGACCLLHPVGAHRRCRDRRASSILQAEEARQPCFVRQGAYRVVARQARMVRGLRGQGGEGGSLQGTHQVGREFGDGEGVRKDDRELGHPMIVSQKRGWSPGNGRC